MALTPDDVARASAAWLWYPDEAEVLETDDFLMVDWPAWFGSPPSLLRFSPTGPVAEGFARAQAAARDWGHEEMVAWVKLDAPEGLEPLLRQHSTPKETLDVFALDLTGGAPSSPDADVEISWRDDLASSRAFVEVGIAAFEEGTMPADDVLLAYAAEAEADRVAGRGGQLLAHFEGRPAGAAGLTMADGTARLWGGAVVPSARRRGVYRALLAARLEYAVAHGATMALVKGRVETSGPILRRTGFEVYGQERSYVVPTAG